MTSWVVADSGLLIATQLTETYSPQADTIFKQWERERVQITAPVLFRYELISAVRKHVYRGTISAQEGDRIRERLLRYPVTIIYDDRLLRRAYELATQLNRPTAYDAQYLALAEHLKCDFWTADEKLYNAVHLALPYVHWLGHFSA